MYRLDRCPQGRWELAQMRPQADLAGDVVRYSGYLEHGGWSIANREVAVPIVPLIINFGAPFRIRMGANESVDQPGFVAGLYDGYADVASTGRAHSMQVDFTPLGAHRFFALPMRDLAGQTVALDGVGRFEELTGRLYDARGWAARFALLDRFVRQRLGAARASSSPIAWAWRQLAASAACGWVPWRGRSAGAASTWQSVFRSRSAPGQNCRPHPALCRGAAIDRCRHSRWAHGLGRPRRRLGLCRLGASDPRVPRHGRRDAGRLCTRRRRTLSGRERGAQVTNLQYRRPGTA
jgi:hypothetical protein